MDTASPFRRTDIISMIPVYKAALTFHLKPFIRWTPTTTIKTSLKGATPKSVLELMNVKYLTLAHGKGHLQVSRNYFLDFKVVEYYRDKGVENWTVECWEKDFSKPQNQKYFKPSSSKTLFIENPLDSLSVSRQHKTKLRLEQHALGSSTDECPYNVMGFRIMSSKS